MEKGVCLDARTIAEQASYHPELTALKLIDVSGDLTLFMINKGYSADVSCLIQLIPEVYEAAV